MTSTLTPEAAPEDHAPGAAHGPTGSAGPGAPAAAVPRSGAGGAVRRLVRGPSDDPSWARPALFGLLAATAVLYLWGLGASGWGNSFYSAAAQAGSVSWKAFFYGSSDAAGSITVDKTPASIWVMALSVRIFGLSSWSILVPQALMGVATTGVLYATVKRWSGAVAGLLAGAVFAVTPIATLMFRFNNPDALLVLCLTMATYCLTRALEKAGTGWLLATFALVGGAFMAKMLQAFLVVPAFGLVYLYAAPTAFWHRVRQLVLGAVALVVSSGWWIAIVELVPASMRPYIGGSQDNSVVNLLFGYNGFGRLTGNEAGSVGGGGPAGGPGGGPGGGMWGKTGWSRMFGADMGTQASWLIPAALLLLGAGLVQRGRRPRTDRPRAALLVWGGWLLVTMATFSFGSGIIHAYYTVALAPAIGALVGIGAVQWWQRRDDAVGRAVLAATVAATAAWAAVLLGRTPDWAPWLRSAVLVCGLAVAVGLLVWPHVRGRAAGALAAAAIFVCLAAPTAYSLSTAAQTHTGSLPTAGPAGSTSGPGGRGFPGGGPGGGFPGGTPGGAPTAGTNGFPGGAGTNGFPGGMPGGGMPGGIGGGPGGGLLDASTPSAALTATLEKDADRYTWVAAAVGSQRASGYQLATGDSVMPIGGFNGSDPSPTLAQFEDWVADGKIHYFIGGGGFGGPGGASGTGTAISSWVSSNFTSQTIGGVTLYDLTEPVS